MVKVFIKTMIIVLLVNFAAPLIGGEHEEKTKILPTIYMVVAVGEKLTDESQYKSLCKEINCYPVKTVYATDFSDPWFPPGLPKDKIDVIRGWVKSSELRAEKIRNRFSCASDSPQSFTIYANNEATMRLASSFLPALPASIVENLGKSIRTTKGSQCIFVVGLIPTLWVKISLDQKASMEKRSRELKFGAYFIKDNTPTMKNLFGASWSRLLNEQSVLYPVKTAMTTDSAEKTSFVTPFDWRVSVPDTILQPRENKRILVEDFFPDVLEETMVEELEKGPLTIQMPGYTLVMELTNESKKML